MATKVDTVVKPRHTSNGGVGGGFQVILYNDDRNVFDYVVVCLMRVFDHGEPMARKIATEAHSNGKAIAQVEGEEEAVRHCLALRLSGLGADVEHI